MAAQSFAMGHAFGTSFQYGKRKISSMTNEEFNALSATDLHGELQADIRGMIPAMNQSFQRMEDFQIDVLKSMAQVIIKAGEQFFGFITGAPPSTTSTSAIDFSETGIFNVQGGARQGDNKPPENPSSSIFLNDKGQTYEEWAKELGAPAIIQRNKAKSDRAKRKVQADIEESRKAAKKITPVQVLDTTVRQAGKTQFKTAAQHNATRAANKKRLQQNLVTAIALHKLKSLEYNRIAPIIKKKAQLILSGRIRASAATAQKSLRNLKILLNTRNDLAKKVANIKQLLRNYR